MTYTTRNITMHLGIGLTFGGVVAPLLNGIGVPAIVTAKAFVDSLDNPFAFSAILMTSLLTIFIPRFSRYGIAQTANELSNRFAMFACDSLAAMAALVIGFILGLSGYDALLRSDLSALAAVLLALPISLGFLLPYFARIALDITPHRSTTR